MLSLFERSQLEGIEAFYRMSKFNCVLKILHFEFHEFGRVGSQFLSDFAEICTRASYHIGKQFVVLKMLVMK